MNYETLKLFRLFIPGVLIFTFTAYARDFLLPKFIIYIPDILTKDDGIKYALYLAVFAIIGVLYDASGIRKLLLDRLQPRINQNINSTLFDAVRNSINLAGIVEKDKNNEVMRVFWFFIDKDPSLTEKSKAVRFNGLLWSTSMDLVIISLFALIFFTLMLIFRHDIAYLKLLTSCVIVTCLAGRTLIAVHNEHLKLSNEQLKIITKRYKTELIDKFNNEVL